MPARRCRRRGRSWPAGVNFPVEGAQGAAGFGDELIFFFFDFGPGAVGGAFDVVAHVFGGAFDFIAGLFGFVAEVLGGLFELATGFFGALFNVFGGFVDAVAGFGRLFGYFLFGGLAVVGVVAGDQPAGEGQHGGAFGEE
jgi:hypothetical protein